MFSLRFIFLYFLLFAGVSYFSYHLLSGEKTIFRFFDNAPKITELEAEVARLKEREQELENKVERLRDGSIDLDLLEEEVRRELYYLRDDEVVLPLSE